MSEAEGLVPKAKGGGRVVAAVALVRQIVLRTSALSGPFACDLG